jgi:hypothetical protein
MGMLHVLRLTQYRMGLKSMRKLKAQNSNVLLLQRQ